MQPRHPDASPAYTRWQSCLRKVLYPEAGDASRAAKQIWKRKKMRLVAYECSYGPHFHLASAKPDSSHTWAKLTRARRKRQKQ